MNKQLEKSSTGFLLSYILFGFGRIFNKRPLVVCALAMAALSLVLIVMGYNKLRKSPADTRRDVIRLALRASLSLLLVILCVIALL
jgi:multisubunit Na+/H+ antiporter MnhB subunit